MTTPKIRFPEFTEQWEESILEKNAYIYDGTHQTPQYISNGIKFVSVENIHDIYNTNKFISEEAYEQYKIKPQIDDILMTRITAGIIGDTAIITKNEPLAYYVSLALIRKKNPEKINTKFLSYYINSDNFKHELHRRIIHVAFPQKINLGDIGKCKIAFPEVNEQKKIANFLTSIDAIITLIEETITVLEEQKKSVIQKVFNCEVRFKTDNGNVYPKWEIDKIKNVCAIQTGNGNTQDKEKYGKYPFFVRSPIIEHSNKYIYDCEAVLTIGDGVNTGKVYHYINGKFNCHQRVYVMSDFKKVLGKYFYYYFMKFFPKRVYSMSAKTSVDSVRRTMIADLQITIPCMEEQRKIIDFLSTYDELIQIKKEKLEVWKEIKKGLLQQMFV